MAAHQSCVTSHHITSHCVTGGSEPFLRPLTPISVPRPTCGTCCNKLQSTSVPPSHICLSAHLLHVLRQAAQGLITLHLDVLHAL